MIFSKTQLETIFCNYENDKLLENKDLLNNADTYNYTDLKNLEVRGMPLSVFRADGVLKVAFTRPSHTLIIGATESGKTTGYISPMIQVLSELKNKSSFFISDPKGELLTTHYNKLLSMGYDVRVVNLRNPNYSDFWNPLGVIYEKFHKSNLSVAEIAKTVKEKTDKNGETVYCFEGMEYNSPDILYDCIKLKQDELKAECDNEISTFAETFIKKENVKDPYWDVSARDLFLASIYLFLEDSLKSKSTITKYNFSLKNVIEFLSNNGLETLRREFSRTPSDSQAYLRSVCIRTNADNTANCIIASAASKLSAYKNYAIMKIMSDTNIDLKGLDGSKPTAVFLIIADEKDSNYDIAVLFTSKMYEQLVQLAEENGGKLKRPFYFILDEFGNLPSFPALSNMLTAGRSREIWITMVVQSYAQIDRAYGTAMREVLKDNCSQKIFFGTNDYETRKAFSRECGKKTIVSPKSFLGGKGTGMEEIITEQVDLVTPTNLNLMTEGTCYNVRFRQPVLKAEIERSYQSAEYDIRPIKLSEIKRTSVLLSDKKYQFDGVFVEPPPKPGFRRTFDF